MAPSLCCRLRAPLYPFIERVFADSAYAADRVATATRIIVEIVRKQAGQIGFAVHPRRWVVERFLAWLGRNRRLAKDFEGTLEFGNSVPLRRFRLAAHTETRSFGLRFELDSKPQNSEEVGQDYFQRGYSAYQQQNYSEAISLYSRGADEGNADCMYSMGYLYAGLFNAQYMTRIARMARMPPKAMRWRPSVTL